MLGLLIRQVAHFVLAHPCPSVQQDYLELRTIYVGQIPAPAVPSEIEAELNKLVARFLDARGQGPQVAAWEQTLNELVYGLYGLTDEEVRLIEEAVGEPRGASYKA